MRNKEKLIALHFEDMVKLIGEINRHSFRAKPFVCRGKGRVVLRPDPARALAKGGQDVVLLYTPF